jgi:hypothetical protein
MKTYVSIFIALLSIIITSQTSDNGDLAMPCGYCGAYGYYLQECTCANEFPLEALAAECNIPIQQVPEGKSGGHPFSMHNIRQNETTNKCGQYRHAQFEPQKDICIASH